MTYFLAPNGSSAADALVIVDGMGNAAREAQLLANRTRQSILAYYEIDGSCWPDERIGDWGMVDPR